MLGTLQARTTERKIKLILASKNKDLMNTNLSPQRVARIVFREIRRFEHYSRTVLEKYHYATEMKGLTHLPPAL